MVETGRLKNVVIFLEINVFSSHMNIFRYVKRPAQKISNDTYFLIALEILIVRSVLGCLLPRPYSRQCLASWAN